MSHPLGHCETINHLCSTAGGNWGTEEHDAVTSCTSLSLGWNPLAFQCGAKSCPECRGSLTESNPSAFKPFPTPSGKQHNRALWRAGEGDEMFLASSCSRCCFLALFVSSVPPEERSTLAGFVLVCVYGWMLPLIANGAIRPFPATVSIASRVWQRIWRTLYLQSRNIHTKGRALQPSHLLSSLLSFRRGNCVSVCVLPAAKDLVMYVCGSLKCTWKGAPLSSSGDISLIKVSGKGSAGVSVLPGLNTRGTQMCLKQKLIYIFQIIFANVNSELFLSCFLFIASDSSVLSHNQC